MHPCLASDGEFIVFRRREGYPVAVTNPNWEFTVND